MKRTLTLSLVMIMVSAAALAAQNPQAKPLTKLKPALLVIDIQNAFLPYMSDQDKKAGMPAINDLIGLFRGNGFPVIRIYHTEPGYGPKPGTKEFEYPESVTIKPDDPKIIKNFGNGFKKTDLDTVLKAKGCNALFLCGLSSIGCVLATYHGALDLDYNVFMVKGALIGPDPALTKAVQDICQTIDPSALILLIEAALVEARQK